MPALVSLADLRRVCRLFPKLQRAPKHARSTMPTPMRRLRVITLAAADDVLLVETAAIRETIPATGTLGAITVNARVLAKHLTAHQAEYVELENVGGLRIASGKFWSVVPAA